MNKLEANVSLFIITFFAAIQYAFLQGVPDTVSHFAFLCVTNLIGFLLTLAVFFSELFRVDKKQIKQSLLLSLELFGFNVFLLLGSSVGATVSACVLSAYFVFLPLLSLLLFRIKSDRMTLCAIVVVLAGLALVFAALLVVIGRKKGLMALAGLLYTLACIWFIQVPMILRGADPVWITILIVVLTTGASLLLLTGISKKTLCATLGCVGGVAAAGLFAALFCVISPLNGFNMSEAEELVLRSLDRDIHISGLFVSGILIASLGAVMDVAMSISSACWELRELNPALPRKALFRSGMNIGKDAMGTMANTLILAFSGSSLNLLLLCQIFDYPLIQIFNTDAIAIELIRGLAGSIGSILTVPLVALLASQMMGPQRAAKK